MRVALINPPQPYLVNAGQLEPLGLQYVEAAVCRAVTLDRLTIVDLAKETDIERAVTLLQGFDVCAYTATTIDYPVVVAMASAAKKQFGALQVLGGPHTRSVKLGCEPPWDAVFHGEGEETFPAYLQELQAGRHPAPVWNAPCDADIDKFAWPTRRAGFKLRSVIGSRGCAMRCAFCSASRLWPRGIRRRKPGDIAAEVTFVWNVFRPVAVSMKDEDIGSDADWTFRFCAAMKDTGARWKAQMRVDRVTPQMCEALLGAGCVEIDLGIETFDQAVLDRLRKRTTAEMNKGAVRTCHAVGLPCRLYMMIGTPGHNKGTVDANIKALEELKGQYSVLNICPYSPLPGTDVHDNPAKFGVTILDQDTSKYHRYAWQRDSAGNVVRRVWSAIDVEGMTHAELIADIERMFAYFDSLSDAEANRGDKALV